jgi:hypothetical protein
VSQFAAWHASEQYVAVKQLLHLETATLLHVKQWQTAAAGVTSLAMISNLAEVSDLIDIPSSL